MAQIRRVAYDAMEEAAARGRYTSSFDGFYYAKMKQSEASARKGDLLFCGAPHLFVAHVKATGRWAADYAINCNLATAYFELLANAHGLGTVIMSYPSDVLCEIDKPITPLDKHVLTNGGRRGTCSGRNSPHRLAASACI